MSEIQFAWASDLDGQDVRDALREQGIPFYEQAVAGFWMPMTAEVTLIHYTSPDGIGKSILSVYVDGADSWYEEYFLFPYRIHPAQVDADFINKVRREVKQ